MNRVSIATKASSRTSAMRGACSASSSGLRRVALSRPTASSTPRLHAASRAAQRQRLVVSAMSGGAPGAPGSGMAPELKRSIDTFIASNKVVVFMKGNREAPQCGFSARVVQILGVMDAQFETVNILEDERLRSGMKEYSQWPTFPQVYINGEFFGGADIVMASAQNGQLKEALEVAFME